MYANERPVLPPATRLKLYILFCAILSLHRIWDATGPCVEAFIKLLTVSVLIAANLINRSNNHEYHHYKDYN